MELSEDNSRGDNEVVELRFSEHDDTKGTYNSNVLYSRSLLFLLMRCRHIDQDKKDLETYK